MDLTSAEKSVQKLLNFIQSVSSSDVKLQERTKKRWSAVASNLLEVVSYVSALVEEEMLQQDRFDVNELQKPAYPLASELNKLKEFSGDHVQNIAPVERKVIRSEELTETLTGDEKRQIVSMYGHLLYDVAKSNIKIKQARDCASYMWNWYNLRILGEYGNAPPFNYSIARIRELLYYIVIAYGYHTEQGTIRQFEESFVQWEYSLSSDKKSNSYLAPYNIYGMYKNKDPKYMNLTAVVLWDILMSSGLENIKTLACKASACITSTGVWNLVQEYNESVLDQYKDYHHQPEILRFLNLEENND